MTKNPLINAILATIYITAIASLMFYGTKIIGTVEDNVLMPISILSLFVLSAAIMGYIFLSQPLQMYLDAQKSEAVGLFLRTVAIFACFTILFFAVLFFLG